MKKNEIAEILGSNRVIKLEGQKLAGPLTYLNLIREVNRRIASKVGRPSDILATKYHNIPLTDEVWKKLQQKTKMIPSKKTLSTSHLATLLIEEGLKRLEAEIDQYNLTQVRE